MGNMNAFVHAPFVVQHIRLPAVFYFLQSTL